MASFDDIKVGDQVVIFPRQKRECRYVASVKRVTRTQFVADGIRFTKAGREVGGDSWLGSDSPHLACAHPVTPDLLADVSRENRYFKALDSLCNLRRALETTIFGLDRSTRRDDSIETLEAAVADLEAALAKLRKIKA